MTYVKMYSTTFGCKVRRLKFMGVVFGTLIIFALLSGASLVA